MNAVSHSVYGLRVRSDRRVPGLAIEPERDDVDLEIHLGTGTLPDGAADLHHEPNATGEWIDDDGEPGWRMWTVDGGRYYRLRYADGTDFLIEGSGRAVWGEWPAPLTIEDTATYLLGPVLRFVLARRGVLCLHASAVVIGGRAVALVGPAGAGKSTTAAAFASRGVPVLSDDLVALTPHGSEFLVQPGYRLVRLWSDVSDAVGGAPGGLPLLTPNWDKRFLALTGSIFASEPVALAAIYLFADARRDAAAPSIAAVPARVALMELVANSRSAYALEPALLADGYRLLGRLREGVRIRRVVPHASLDHLQRLCEVIEADVLAHPAQCPALERAAAAGASR